MNTLFEQLSIRKKKLQEAIDKAQFIVSNSPEGKLRVARTDSGPHYFRIISPHDTNGEYIPLANRELVSQLAEKSYALQLIKKASEEIKDINRLLNKGTLEQTEEVYTKMNSYRKKLVEPILMSDDEYLSRWINESFRTNLYRCDEKQYETNNHEWVRSKSEKDIANILCSMGIPYRYEAELILKNGGVRYPDFTLLDIKKRKQVYFEHFGLMDDSGYRRENFQKLNEYCENGIILGKNLIFSFEAQGSPFNERNIRKMLREVFEL